MFKHTVLKLISGLELCFVQTVDPALLKLVTKEVAELHTSVQSWKLESDTQVRGNLFLDV